MSIESIEARLEEAEKMASLVKLTPEETRLLLDVAKAARAAGYGGHGRDCRSRLCKALDALEAGK